MISKHIINNSYFYVDESENNISISYSNSPEDMIKIKKKYDTSIHLNIFHLFLHHIQLRNLDIKDVHKIQLDVLYNEVFIDVKKHIEYLKNEYILNKDLYYKEIFKNKLSGYRKNELIYFLQDENLIINWHYGENKHVMNVSIYMREIKKEVFSKKLNLTYLNIDIDNLFIITLLLLIELDEKLKKENKGYTFNDSFLINQKDFLKENLLES